MTPVLAWRQASGHPVDVVVIGASAGGFSALMSLLPGLPESYPVPIVIVLHLPDHHESRVAELLGFKVALRVCEARDKEFLQPGTVYFAPPGYHLSIERDRCFSLSCEDRVSYARPSIDVLMLSVADAYGARAAGMLLTGANFDGAAGLAGMKSAGGLAIVQDPATAEVATMPQAAIRTMNPDLILSLLEIHTLLKALGVAS